MKLYTIFTLLLLGLLVTPAAFAQVDDDGFQNPETEKSAQTGFKFLSLSIDPRASALAGAMTAEGVGNATSMFYNPASMAYQTGFASVSVMQTQFIADINYNAGSIAFSPRGGAFGTFGVSVVAVDYGDFEGTIRDDIGVSGGSGYIDTGNFSPTALAVGVGYARALSDRFAIGGNVKYALQDLGAVNTERGENNELITDDYSLNTMVFDFGVLYKTGFRSLNFAMSVRNFSQELKYEQEAFELPLTFQIGVGMDMVDLTNMDRNVHSLKVNVDATRPRDFAEQIRIGGEYEFMKTLSLRAGYAFPTDVEGVNLGLGLQHSFNNFGFAFNYAYTTYDVFDAVHRLGVQLSF